MSCDSRILRSKEFSSFFFGLVESHRVCYDSLRVPTPLLVLLYMSFRNKTLEGQFRLSWIAHLKTKIKDGLLPVLKVDVQLHFGSLCHRIVSGDFPFTPRPS